MTVKITVVHAVGALYNALLESDDVRRHSRPVVHRNAGAPGQMGTDGGWIELLVTSGLNVTAIVVAVAAWLRPRQAQSGPSPTAVIEHGEVTVVLSDPSPEAIDAAVRALRDVEHD